MRILIISFVLLSGLIFNSCGSNSSKEIQKTTKEEANVEYTCLIHPDVVSSKLGDCPVCGMGLVEKE